MKICLVSLEYPPETGWGGVGTQTYLKARGLSRRGHDVHVISGTWSAEARVDRDGGATIHRILVPDLWVARYDGPAFWLAYSAAVALKLQALDAEVGFDIIQFPEYGGEGLVYQTATFEARTARYVVQLHGPMSMFAEHWGWPPPATPYMEVGAFIEGSTIRYADLLLASSHTTARFCSERYGCALDAIDVIHSGIDTTLFQPRPSRAVSSGPNVLFVGKLSAGKGIGTLVAAVLDLIDRYPGIRLRAVGKSGGDFLAELSARVGARGAEERVEFTGNVAYEQLPAHYNWCDLFVAPTVFEPGPGNVYLEAMACGKPVIACSGGGAAEVVLHERTGLLVAPNSVDAVAAAIAALADDAGRREEIGKAGRLWVEQEFSVERYLDKVEAAYQRALGTA